MITIAKIYLNNLDLKLSLIRRYLSNWIFKIQRNLFIIQHTCYTYI